MACDSALKIKDTNWEKIENGKNSKWKKWKNSHFFAFSKMRKTKNGKKWENLGKVPHYSILNACH